VRYFIGPDLFDNNVLFNNTIPIYVINLLWKLGLGLHYFSIYARRIMKTSTLSSVNSTEGKVLLKECTQIINNKIKFHIVGVLMNKLSN